MGETSPPSRILPRNWERSGNPSAWWDSRVSHVVGTSIAPPRTWHVQKRQGLGGGQQEGGSGVLVLQSVEV